MIAVALSPKARALIQAHRDARRPTAEDRERVEAALRARLGATVLPLDTPAFRPLMSAGIQRRFAGAFGLCVVGSVLFLTARPEAARERTPQVRDMPAEAVASVTVTPMPSLATPSIEAPVAPQQKTALIAPQRARPKAAPTATPRDTLGEELALLTSAASQLSAGQASGALLSLDEHQRRFSHGVLTDERKVAKARALCILHRFDEGRAALAQLGAGTPSAARVQEECDAAWTRAHTAELSRKALSN